MHNSIGLRRLLAFALACFPFMLATAQTNSPNPGIFTADTDIGTPLHAGSVQYDAAQQTYTVGGGGVNMWFTNDACHFVWKKVSGDVTLAADINFVGTSREPHRKACLIIRQSLDADSPYVDAVLHGNGLTALQCRDAKGALTREVQSNVNAPRRLRVEKHGKYISMSVAGAGEALHPAGGSFRLELEEPFYVGLAVSAHNDKAFETAVFSNVELVESAPAATNRNQRLISTLETMPIASKDRSVVWWTTNLIEAPNWSRDGKALFFNSRGRIYQLPLTNGTPLVIDSGFAIKCNNDHGLSPDGTQLAVSDQSQGDKHSRIYTLPIGGGAPKLMTPTGPSYWHGWSPDGKTLAFCGERNGEFDIYTVPAAGGPETRLTTAPGLDDGPDYSPDGQFIYFNSERTGRMQVWRMKADGSQQEQVTSDEWNNWFPHPSPNGRWVVFLSYAPDVKGHPANQDVMLRLLSVKDGKIEVLAKLFGGQGTINVPSWSPDGSKLAFVSYQLVP
jgi:hypothetical protein